MTYVRTRCGADRQPRYTAYFHDARGRERSADTYPLSCARRARPPSTPKRAWSTAGSSTAPPEGPPSNGT